MSDSPDPVVRVLAGVALSAAVAIGAHRRGSLTRGGQWAAFVTGTVAVAAGWPWAALLLAFFVSSTLLTRVGAAAKRRRTEAVVEPERARAARQVFANGGVFLVAALVRIVLPGHGEWWLAAGALAAACADTWATEVGTLLGGPPRDILGRGPLPVGMSGGITAVGTLATVGGALLVGGVASALAPAPGRPLLLAVIAAGVAGSLADSLLGATVQARRWCPACESWCERRIHPCGSRTSFRRGVRWITNDVVNLLATLVGGGAAWLAWAVLP